MPLRLYRIVRLMMLVFVLCMLLLVFVGGLREILRRLLGVAKFLFDYFLELVLLLNHVLMQIWLSLLGGE